MLPTGEDDFRRAKWQIILSTGWAVVSSIETVPSAEHWAKAVLAKRLKPGKSAKRNQGIEDVPGWEQARLLERLIISNSLSAKGKTLVGQRT